MASVPAEKEYKVMEMASVYEVKDLTFKYPGYERKILDRASLVLKKGEIMCILGPNGAGKTTLLSCMAGLLSPESGDIELCGKSIRKMSEKEIASVVGYVPQIHTPAFDYRVIDFVLMGMAPKTGLFGRPGREEETMCMEVLDSMGLADMAEKSYLDISGGERQQLLIARAIVHKPEVVLFDEPTAHLDYGNQHRVLSRIKKMASEGYSVVITTHNPDHALLLGDKAAIVSRDGSIIQGESNEIVTEESLSRVYGLDVHIRYIEDLGRTACLVPGL